MHGNAIAYDADTGWSSPTNVDATNELVSVSCPTSRLCATVDSVGHAVTFRA